MRRGGGARCCGGSPIAGSGASMWISAWRAKHTPRAQHASPGIRRGVGAPCIIETPRSLQAHLLPPLCSTRPEGGLASARKGLLADRGSGANLAFARGWAMPSGAVSPTDARSRIRRCQHRPTISRARQAPSRPQMTRHRHMESAPHFAGAPGEAPWSRCRSAVSRRDPARRAGGHTCRCFSEWPG